MADDKKTNTVLQQRGHELTHLVSFYKSSAEVVSQCLFYPMTRLIDIDPDQLLRHPYVLSDRLALLNFLNGITNKVAQLYSHDCYVMFMILDGLNPNNGRVDLTLERIEVARHATWIHGNDISSPSTDSSQKGNVNMHWSRFGEGFKDIIMNLANSCVSKASRSAIEISNPNIDWTQGSAVSGSSRGNVLILSFPLLYSNGSSTSSCNKEVLGVMQFIINKERSSSGFSIETLSSTASAAAEEEKKSSSQQPIVDRIPIEQLSEDLAGAIACILSHEVASQLLSAQVQTAESCAILAESKCSEVSSIKEQWKRSAWSWQNLSAFATDLITKCSSPEEILEVFRSADASDALAEAGITIRVRKPSTEGSAGGIFHATSQLATRTTVPLTVKNESYNIEIVHKEHEGRLQGILHTAPSGSDAVDSSLSLGLSAGEIVQAAADVIRGLVQLATNKKTILHQHSKEQGHALSKIEKLKTELKRTRDELTLTTAQKKELLLTYQMNVEHFERFKNQIFLMNNAAYSPLFSELDQLVYEMGSSSQHGKATQGGVGDDHGVDINQFVKAIDRVVSRCSSSTGVAGRVFRYHLSILQREPQSTILHESGACLVDHGKDSDPIFKVLMHDGTSQANKLFPVLGEAARQRILPTSKSSGNASGAAIIPSILEKCFRVGGVYEAADSTILPADLVGIHDSVLLNKVSSNSGSAASGGRSGSSKAAKDGSIHMLCASLRDGQPFTSLVMRLVYISEPIIPTHDESQPPSNTNTITSANTANVLSTQNPGLVSLSEMFEDSSRQIVQTLLRNVIEGATLIGGSILRLQQASIEQSMTISRPQSTAALSAGGGAQIGSAARDLSSQDAASSEQLKTYLSRLTKLYKVVMREASSLLDPPLITPSSLLSVSGTGAGRVVHPASLTPVMASQDCCLKILALMRTLLRSEGQALLLRDETTVPASYQVIYTGDALQWPGIQQGTFGCINAQTTSKRVSLVETVLLSRRSLTIANAVTDARYCSYVDGICSLGTPMMIVPVRGRGGAVVGAFVAAKGAFSTSRPGYGFNSEDTMAAEMACAFGALSLYWCQGIGSLHQQMNKMMNTIEQKKQVKPM